MTDNTNLENAAKSAGIKNIEQIMASLSPNDRKKVEDIVNDPQKLNELLKNPLVQSYLNRYRK
jgi:hypothetical protein